MTERSTPNDSRRRSRRLFVATLAGTALAALSSGCVVFRVLPSSTQLNTIGKVQITTTFCASDGGSDNPGYNPIDSSCQGSSHGGNLNSEAANNSSLQLQLAYRIPTSVQAPDSFTSVNSSNPPATACGGGIVFTKNASFGSALQALSPAGSGKQWVGYTSSVQSYTLSGCQYVKVSPQFTLVQGFGIAPFVGPLNYRVVVGYRTVNESQPGNTSARAVTCGTATITEIYRDGADADSNGTLDMSGICADDPSSSTISGVDLSQTTRDLGVLPTVGASVQAGSSAQVTFNLSYKGVALPSGQFNLSANTNIPGASATPSQASLVPAADSDNNVNVNVPVPANTTPGTYNVFLIATLSTDPSQTRGGLVPAQITVGEAFGLNTAPTLPSLGTITLNGQAQTKNATMSNFSVIDSPGSSDVGWNVTAVGDGSAGKSARFKEYCPSASCGGGHTGPGYVGGGFLLAANSLTLNTSTGSWSGGTGTTPSFTCNAGGCAIDAATPTKIANAPVGGGTALWNATGFGSSSLRLATPTTLRALTSGEQYHLDVVWTLNSGP